MADPNIKISITADDKATGKLKALDAQVDKTQGGMGNLGKAAAIGGAALVALGVKSVLAFEDLGLTVGKFADATGATAEEASRLIEVGDDIGISAETLSSSIGKMSKQLGASKDAFKEFGIEVQKNADGTTNVNETFLHAVDTINKIEDPLKKAEASAKVFGKGYQQMGELLGQSSDKIRTSLAAVSDQKVFDDKKVKDARDMRAAFDSIVDAGQDLLLTIGSALAPVITKLAPTLTKVVEAAAPLAKSLGEVLTSALEAVGPIIEALLPVIQKLAVALSFVADVIGKFKPTGFTKEIQEIAATFDEVKQKALDAGLSTDEFAAMLKAAQGEIVPTGDTLADMGAAVVLVDDKLTEASASADSASGAIEHMGIAGQDAGIKVRNAAEDMAEAATQAGAAQRATDNLRASWDLLKGTLSDQQAWIDVENSFADVKQAGIDAFTAAADGTDDADQKARDYQSSLITLKQKVVDYHDEIGGLPFEVATKILADIDEGSIATADQLLDAIAHERQVIYNAQVAGHRENVPGLASGTARVPGALGQPFPAMLHGGEQVIGAGGNGHATPPIIVNISGVVGDKSAVIRWVHEGLKEAQRQQGLSGLA